MSGTHVSDQERAAASHTGVTSLVALLHARAVDAFDRTALVEPTCAAVGGSPPMTSHTWGALLAAAIDYGHVLEAAGLSRGDRLVHVGPHSAEWIVVDLACLITGIVHVPLHDDETDAGIRSQLAWLSPRGLVCGGRRDVAAATPAFVRVPRPAPLAEPRAADVEAVRRHLADRVEACDPDAPAAFFLSSGTTGRPRAIVHCQRALAWNATAASTVFLDDHRDVRLSWLPLSHASARVGDLYTALVRGGSMCVVGDRRRVLDACSLARPTVILGVPAFFDRIAAAVVAGRIPDLPAALGGEVRVCVSGGAPLRVRTAETFAARGVPLVEGYGLAEAGPVVALASPRTSAPGTVGPPLPGIEVTFDGHGQVRVRSPSVAIAAIDPDGPTAVAAPDGLLDTGDVGTLDAEGRLSISGRVVDTLVLSNGMKVPPGEVERTLAEDPVVAQVCVLGQGLTAPVALVVPEPDVVKAAVRRLGLRVWSRGRALRHPRLLRWLARRLAARQVRLPRAWRARRAVFVARPFDTAHGEATAALKLKRTAIAAHFAHVVRAAAAAEPPSWMTAVPASRNGTATRGTRDAAAPSLAAAVWQRGDAGFAAAAAAAATPPHAALEAVLEQVDRTLAVLRADGALYDPAPHHTPAAPLDDAPPAPRGRLSATAEARLGDTGLWGLAVPERFGGGGAGMLDLVRAITHVAERTPTAAGLLSVHSSIGAVSALAAFGSPEQQARHFPGLAQGRPLSIFGATEPDAGCDLSRIRTTVEETGAGLVVSGTKMFITGANHGRLVKLLARHAGRPTVVLVRLPDADTPTFRLRHYALHPLKHAHNAALEFVQFPIDPADILAAPPHRGDGDAMAIIWHGLNRGRITLAAQVAGTLRVMLSQARDHAVNRRTWGAAIASRQLVQGRLGRIAARIAACDAMAAWAAVSVDAGGSGELEAIAAKIVASECVRESASDALGIHGGRAFLVGHPLGDALHDHLAVTVYEGESDLLGLALFKGLAKRHPLATTRASSALGRAAGWLAWRIGGLARHPHDAPILDAALRRHARRARRSLESASLEIDRAGRRHGAGLADRQLEIGDMSARVRYLVSVLAVAHHADAAADDRSIMAADAWCRLALARADGRRPGPDDQAAVAALGRATVG